jgi:integrase/recombinase XerD
MSKEKEPPYLVEFAKHLSIERGLSPNTVLAYSSDLNDYLLWLDRKDALRADAKLLEDYLWYLKSDKKLKAVSIYRKMEALRAFYKFQSAEERIAEDPTRNFKAPHLPERLPKFLRLNEIEAILRVADEGKFHLMRAKTIAELLYATGMRASELLGLRGEYVNIQEGWVRVLGKGTKERMIPLHDKARQKLVQYLHVREQRFAGKGPDPEVFLGRGGKALSRVQLWRDLKGLGVKARLARPLHPHLLRHTFASHLIQGGADARSVQELLGHADLSTTQVYTHLEASGLKEMHKKAHPRG